MDLLNVKRLHKTGSTKLHQSLVHCLHSFSPDCLPLLFIETCSVSWFDPPPVFTFLPPLIFHFLLPCLLALVACGVDVPLQCFISFLVIFFYFIHIYVQAMVDFFTGNILYILSHFGGVNPSRHLSVKPDSSDMMTICEQTKHNHVEATWQYQQTHPANSGSSLLLSTSFEELWHSTPDWDKEDHNTIMAVSECSLS